MQSKFRKHKRGINLIRLTVIHHSLITSSEALCLAIGVPQTRSVNNS